MKDQEISLDERGVVKDEDVQVFYIYYTVYWWYICIIKSVFLTVFQIGPAEIWGESQQKTFKIFVCSAWLATLIRWMKKKQQANPSRACQFRRKFEKFLDTPCRPQWAELSFLNVICKNFNQKSVLKEKGRQSLSLF